MDQPINKSQTTLFLILFPLGYKLNYAQQTQASGVLQFMFWPVNSSLKVIKYKTIKSNINLLLFVSQN